MVQGVGNACEYVHVVAFADAMDSHFGETAADITSK